MGTVSVSLPADGTTGTVSQYNTPITTLVNELNGNIDANNIADSSVTTAKLAAATQFATKALNPYKFSVYRNAVWNMSASSWNKVSFDTEEYDTGSNYDNTTTFRFTVPVAGFYKFSAAVSGQGITTNTYIAAIYKNGVVYKQGQQVNIGATADFTVTVAPPAILLAVSDYIEVYVYNGNGASQAGRTGAYQTYFGGELVSIT